MSIQTKILERLLQGPAATSDLYGMFGGSPSMLIDDKIRTLIGQGRIECVDEGTLKEAFILTDKGHDILDEVKRNRDIERLKKDTPPVYVNVNTEFDPQDSCFAKKRYSDESHAKEIAKKCLDKRGGYLRVYACTLCGGYHLTHTKR